MEVEALVDPTAMDALARIRATCASLISEHERIDQEHRAPRAHGMEEMEGMEGMEKMGSMVDVPEEAPACETEVESDVEEEDEAPPIAVRRTNDPYASQFFLALSLLERAKFMPFAASQIQENARPKSQPATQEKSMEEANTFNQLASDETTCMPAPAAIRNEQAAVSSKDKAWSILQRGVTRRLGCDKCEIAYNSPQARLAFACNRNRQADACDRYEHAVSMDDLVSMVRGAYAADRGDKKIAKDVMELMKEMFDGLTPLGDERSKRKFQISLYKDGETKATRFSSPHYMFPGVMIVNGDTAEGAGEAGIEEMESDAEREDEVPPFVVRRTERTRRQTPLDQLDPLDDIDMHNFRYDVGAMAALGLVRKGVLCAKHRKRKTVAAKDLAIVRKIQKL